MTLSGIDHDRLTQFAVREAKRYAHGRPKSRAAAGNASFLDAVPMHWMKDWPLPFPLLVEKAEGARITDIDGYDLDDFCLGDTAAMFGHSPKPLAKAIRKQARLGLATMLPSDLMAEVGRLLTDRFGEFRWQIATTASDANRCALRVARAVTRRPKVLVFNGAYHGSVDDTMIALRDGTTVPRAGLLGQSADLTTTGISVEFNDPEALEAALLTGEIAAIIAEPIMTNSCMVMPQPGFHDTLRRLATRHGALLILDETHTLSSGLGGCTATYGLDPDILVVGKAVAGGMPTAVWGLRGDIARRYRAADDARPEGHSGMGTTLSANPMQFACLVATLTHLMTADNYAWMEDGALRLADGLNDAITARNLPWHVQRVGARVEVICAPGPLRNGTEAALAHAPDLEAALNLGLVNRGCLIAPFHNMMLVSPATKKRQIARLVAAFSEILTELHP